MLSINGKHIGIAGMCGACWHGAPAELIEAKARELLRSILPRGEFEVLH